MSRNLYALFQSRFPKDLSAPCLMDANGVGISYGALDEKTAKMAGCLLGLGVKKGDRVAVQADKSQEAVVLYLACLRAGAVYLPLNTAYTADELDYFLSDATPVIVVCDPKMEAALKPIVTHNKLSHLLTLDGDGLGSLMAAFEKAVSKNEICEVEGDELAAILYTSGTTGRSKGAMLSHDNLSSNAEVLHKYWGWVEGDVLLHALPIFHVHGLFVALHCALMNGSAMWFLPKFDPAVICKLLPKSTVMMGVPTFYTRLLDYDGFKADICKNMRLFISGSAPLLEETFNHFKSKIGMSILERYGMTEAGMITSNPLNGARVAGTVGYPLPGVRARLRDENGLPVSEGEPGVLEITGPNVFKGYWQMPEKTAEEFSKDGFFITGDIATIANDGRIAIVGRAKDLIISGGYNVYPKEIELIIDDVAGVKESAVIGLSHPDFGEAVFAVIVKDGTIDIDAAGVKDCIQGKLAMFKQPKSIVFVDELPRNTMGKVQKKTLREIYAKLFK